MSDFHVVVAKVTEVFTHPDEGLEHLSIVKANDKTFIAGKLDGGDFRYKVGDLVITIPNNAIIPVEELKFQGFYWDSEKDRGMLKGSKRNRVGAVARGSITSDGILFPLTLFEYNYYTSNSRGETDSVIEGEDLEDFFNIAEYIS